MKNCKFVRIGFCLLGLLTILRPSGLTLATGSEGGFEKEVDGYHVQLVFEGHPKTGSNEIGIRITDPGDNPLLGAVVEVSPVQVAGAHSMGETVLDGEVTGEHAEGQSEAHTKPGEEMGNGHSDSPTMDAHGEAESVAESHQDMEAESMAEDHPEMEAEVHEETGGHSESKSILLTVSEEEGLYSGEISFPEPGEWSVSVRILLEDEMGEKELNFPVDVIASGPPWAVLSGFFGINFIIMAVAGFLKRKPPAVKS